MPDEKKNNQKNGILESDNYEKDIKDLREI